MKQAVPGNKRTLDRIVEILTYSHLNGKVPPRSALHDFLRQFERRDVVLRLIWLNTLTMPASPPNVERDKELVRYVFAWDADRIEYAALQPGRGRAFVFTRFGILWLLARAFRECPDAGRKLDREAFVELGYACLIANDLAYGTTLFQATQTMLPTLHTLVPGNEYFPRLQELEVVRVLSLLRTVAPNSQRPEVRRLPSMVAELMGLSIEEYFDIVVLCASSSLVLDGYKDVESFVVHPVKEGNFSRTSLPLTKVTALLKSLSASASEFATSLSHITDDGDVTTFRKYPYLMDNEGCFCIDPGFALDKVGNSLYWTLFESRASSQEKNMVASDWGYLFEEYIQTFLSRYLIRSHVIRSPTFPNGDEAFDVLIVEKDVLVAVECKSSCLPGRVKFGASSEDFKKEVEERFVYGVDHKLRGLRQLGNSIRRLTEGEPIHGPDGQCYSWRQRNRLIPLLVHQERSLALPLLNSYLTQRFTELYSWRPETVVRPPVIAHIYHLEELAGSFHDHQLHRLLESYLYRLSRDPAAIFEQQSIPGLGGKRRLNPVLAQYNRDIDAMMHRVFPDYPGKGRTSN